MSCEIYRYTINQDIPFQEVEESLLLSVLATESVYGRSLVRLDASFCLEKKKYACVIDASTDVGRHIAKVFTGFLTQEFGDGAFKVTRLDKKPENTEVNPENGTDTSLKEEKNDPQSQEVS